ncbi:Asp23/Gls24 family envelope stress response protein [Glaciihabitans sp. dw_435]|uniref:Asp23/Gls24 family envelope stress response protein n=1 Tax=Glaciihabitans sp. dw_435 TaxID=2720081 RepID=UPI001BD5F435|nr:Asp23/Gls24 family envelope stress response protein [Glaciihabitans sp. dw_435]
MSDLPVPGASVPGVGVPAAGAPASAPRDDLDGHTIEELSDYLDAGRNPRNTLIEQSPGCLIALDGLTRLRAATQAMLAAEAEQDARDDSWIGNVLNNITREARAGRDIPISDPDPRHSLSVTEGSVRGLIRAAADATGGAFVGRCELVGDVTLPGEPITVNVTVSVAWGSSLPVVTELMRARIFAALALHTELAVVAVNITVDDVHAVPAVPAPSSSSSATAATPPTPAPPATPPSPLPEDDK